MELFVEPSPSSLMYSSESITDVLLLFHCETRFPENVIESVKLDFQKFQYVIDHITQLLSCLQSLVSFLFHFHQSPFPLQDLQTVSTRHLSIRNSLSLFHNWILNSITLSLFSQLL
ncbi:hypothetical protein L1887_07507 [Cichorium endivia]|nr:hypothetical protein L1887_07507 [Cichorium endivia]